MEERKKGGQQRVPVLAQSGDRVVRRHEHRIGDTMCQHPLGIVPLLVWLSRDIPNSEVASESAGRDIVDNWRLNLFDPRAVSSSRLGEVKRY